MGEKGIAVETDESKFYKRKYNRGRGVDGVWVLGMVERTPERRINLFCLKKWDRLALNTLITKYVAKGSIIHTNKLKGYSGLTSLWYKHYTVNHSKNFKDLETGIHTNTIEESWRAIKRKITLRKRNYTLVKPQLKIFMFQDCLVGEKLELLELGTL